MKAGIRSSVMIAILILLLVAGVSLTQARQMGNTIPPTGALPQGANLPWVAENVDIAPNLTHVGMYTSLAFRPYDDYPMISYYDQTNGALMLANPTDIGYGSCGENADWNCITLDQTGDVGQFTSIDVWGNSEQNWKYGISYYDATNRALKARIVSCVDGSCTGGNITISSPDFPIISIGLYTSFKFSSTGIPGIAYHVVNTSATDSLMYAYPVTSGGNCGEGTEAGLWECQTVDHGEGVGQYASQDLSWDDQVFIAYYDAGLGNLKYAYFAGFGACDNGWECFVLDGADGSDVGSYASITAPQFSGDLYRIVYYDKTNGHLKYYDLPWGPLIVDDMGTSLSPMGISMAIDNGGYPIIAYQKIESDFSNPILLVARPYMAFNDDSLGNCGDVPPGYVFQYWRCNILDNAGQYLSEAEYVSVAVNSSGVAEIAYPEFYAYDQGDNNTSLKVIYQVYLHSFLPILFKP